MDNSWEKYNRFILVSYKLVDNEVSCYLKLYYFNF